MFQFRRFPTYTYFVQCTLLEYCSSGFPHSEISGSQDICSSPKLIAACHVLRRLLMPRHSPCALSSLTFRTILLDWFSVRIMQAIHSVSQNCNCYPHLFRCCSTIKYHFFLQTFVWKTSLLPCKLLSILSVQFSRCRSSFQEHLPFRFHEKRSSLFKSHPRLAPPMIWIICRASRAM